MDTLGLTGVVVVQHLRANGFRTYIVTGGGQDFVRIYAEQVYGIPPEQVVGTAVGVKYGYAKDGRPMLTREPKLLLALKQVYLVVLGELIGDPGYAGALGAMLQGPSRAVAVIHPL
jgi:hypothetical protein